MNDLAKSRGVVTIVPSPFHRSAEERRARAARSVATFVVLVVATSWARADTVSVGVDAQANCLVGNANITIPIPPGIHTYTVAATGSAFYAPGRLFADVMIEYKDGETSVQRAVPVGGSVDVVHDNSHERPLYAYFIDSDSADNSGQVTLAVTSGSFPTIAMPVDAALNAILDAQAVSIELPWDSCVVSASGFASFGWGSFRTVTVSYDEGYPTYARHLMGVELNSTATPIPSLGGGSVELFFWDGGGISDNYGLVEVSFTCSPPVSAEGSTWGGIKGSYR